MDNDNKMQLLINYKDFLEREIISAKNKLLDYNKEFDKVKKYIYDNCNHEWINDNIDQMEGYKQSISIKYCDKCLLTKTT